VIELLGGDINLDGEYSQEPQRQYQYDREFGAWVHLHIPHEKDRKYTKDPIRDCRDSTMCIGDVGYHGSSQTMLAGCTWLAFSHPEITSRRALEDEKEEIHGAKHQDKASCEVYDDTLISFAGETKEVSGNGELRDGGRDNVEEFTDEDNLRYVSGRVWRALERSLP
jgi:hypothetical protein